MPTTRNKGKSIVNKATEAVFNVIPFDTFKRENLDWRIAQPYNVAELMGAVIMSYTYAILATNVEQKSLALAFAQENEKVARNIEYSNNH